MFIMQITQLKDLSKKFRKVIKFRYFSLESQVRTQRGESKRPFGVGLLIAGYDVRFLCYPLAIWTEII